MMTEEQRYKHARKLVKKKKAFYAHFSTYLVMGAFFLILNTVTSPGHWWWYWPMLGWGIGVGIQYLNTFGMPGSGAGSSDWEAREIEKEMDKLKPDSKSERLNLDDHLELKEVKKERAAAPTYRKDDLV